MYINPHIIFDYAYRLLENVTPVRKDCGALCGAACCADSDVGTGMYLYPAEECMLYPLPDWVKIEASGFYYNGRQAALMSCPGNCDRALRPLACRIFPLVPYKKPGERMKIIFDPRAKAMCPLTPSDLTDKFKDAVTRAMRAVVKTKEGRMFIEAQSELIDEYVRMHL
ncbi:MAG: hypothetical protein E7390_07345 [Ruminococcaceae bacterium]|nr:hypothetical protein [Oscillospiraceae bacterium]